MKKELVSVAKQALEYLKESSINKPHFIKHATEVIKQAEQEGKFRPYYTNQFTANTFGKPISISRGELESLGCPIDVTEVTDVQMEIFATKLYESDGQTILDIGEAWLLSNTKAKYLEDYTPKQLKTYGERAKKLYYNH